MSQYIDNRLSLSHRERFRRPARASFRDVAELDDVPLHHIAGLCPLRRPQQNRADTAQAPHAQNLGLARQPDIGFRRGQLTRLALPEVGDDVGVREAGVVLNCGFRASAEAETQEV